MIFRDPDIVNFEERGLDNVKLHVLRGTFASEKDEKARHWIKREERRFLRPMFYVGVAVLIATIFIGVFLTHR